MGKKTVKILHIASLLAILMTLNLLGGCGRRDPADDIQLYWPDGMSGSQSETMPPDDADDSGSPAPHAAPQSFASQITEFKAKNADAVGWLYLPDTAINEVVVQDETGNEKKFTQLKKLLNKDFAEKHPYIYFSSETQDYVYEVFAAMYANSDKFYYIDCNFEKTSLKDLVNTAKEGSIFNYPVEVGEDDKIITLSTCTYKFGDSGNQKQRFVVFGRLLTEEEEMPDTITLTENPAPKMPVF